MTDAPTDRLLTAAELAEFLGVPLATLYAWRHAGTGPSAYKIGRHLRYRRADIEAWLATRADPSRSTPRPVTRSAPTGRSGGERSWRS